MQRLPATFLAILLVPTISHAQVISQIAGLFNIISGLMLVFAFLFFFGGLGMWVGRLGTYPTYRDDAIELMQWGVVILFVLAVLLALVQFVQKHTAMASFLVGIVVVGLLGWLILSAATAQKPEKDAH